MPLLLLLGLVGLGAYNQARRQRVLILPRFPVPETVYEAAVPPGQQLPPGFEMYNGQVYQSELLRPIPMAYETAGPTMEEIAALPGVIPSNRR